MSTRNPGVQLGEGHLQPPVAPLDGGEDFGVMAQGLLDGGLQVLDQDGGGAHVHLPQVKSLLPVEEALAGEHILQRLIRGARP